jgi:hypothetical protein
MDYCKKSIVPYVVKVIIKKIGLPSGQVGKPILVKRKIYILPMASPFARRQRCKMV